MKRKLVSYDVFEQMNKQSHTVTERELKEAAPILSKILNLAELSLKSFDSEQCIYENVDGQLIHTTFKTEPKAINFESIEQLAIDTDSETEKCKATLSSMLDAILEQDEAKAESLFAEYLSLPINKRTFKEAIAPKKEENIEKKICSKKCKFMCKDKKAVKEWAETVEAISAYLDCVEFGPIVKESEVTKDNAGNVLSAKVLNVVARNEAKLASCNWQAVASDMKKMRTAAKALAENSKFAVAVAELKRFNNISDNAKLEESLENIAASHSEVLFLTESELSEVIETALNMVRATNFDSSTCGFMAEGILRTVHAAYVDRVASVMKLAGVEINEGAQDKYAQFKSTVDSYYAQLDEQTKLEKKIFIDLYEALRQIHVEASEVANRKIIEEVSSHLNELLAIISEKVEPSLEVAKSATEWLKAVVETNLDTQKWEVPTPVISANGDNPAVTANAKKSYAPATDAEGANAEVSSSDGKKVAKAEAGLADEDGKDVYPNLSNSFVPAEKAAKGETEEGLADEDGKDVYPNLSNPFVPKAKDVE